MDEFNWKNKPITLKSYNTGSEMDEFNWKNKHITLKSYNTGTSLTGKVNV